MLLEREGILIVQLKHPIDFKKKMSNEYTNSKWNRRKFWTIGKIPNIQFLEDEIFNKMFLTQDYVKLSKNDLLTLKTNTGLI